MLSYIINIITMKNFALFNIGGCAALSWISFSLGQFRLLCFAQAGSMSSLPGLTPFGRVVRPEIRLLDYWRSQGLVCRLGIPAQQNN